jgi:hypothetical protein
MRSEDDVRTALNLPVLAAIPSIGERMSRGRRVLISVSAATAAAVVIGGAVVVFRYLR